MSEDPKTQNKLPEAVEMDLTEEPQNDRTTMVLQTYFEQHGETPSQYTFRNATSAPPAGEDPWTRRINVGEEWALPDLGWLSEKVSLLIFENLAGKGRASQPTAEEREAIAKQDIEVSFGAGLPACVIRPGKFILFEPVDAEAVRVRSLGGTVKMLLVALPAAGD